MSASSIADPTHVAVWASKRGKHYFYMGIVYGQFPVACTDWEFMLEVVTKLVYAEIDAPGLVNFNAAVAHRVCPSLPDFSRSLYTGCSSHLRTKLPKSNSRPLPAYQPNHAT